MVHNVRYTILAYALCPMLRHWGNLLKVCCVNLENSDNGCALTRMPITILRWNIHNEKPVWSKGRLPNSHRPLHFLTRGN